jgi:tetratricopeptide (TPR) repeat protein
VPKTVKLSFRLFISQVMLLKKFIFCFTLAASSLSFANAQTPTSTKFDLKTDSLKQQLQHFSKNDSNRVNVLIELAVWYNTFDLTQALTYLIEAEKIAKQLDKNNYIAKVHFTYGNTYLNIANYQQALFHFLQALHIFEQLNKIDNEARCLYNIGVIYISLNKPNLAEKYFTQALDLKLKHGLLDEIGIAYTGVGYIAELNKNYPKALYYYKKTLANGIEKKNSHIIQIAYSDIGGVYLALQDMGMAKKYITLALNMSIDAKNIEQICINYLSMGNIYLHENDLKQAEYYYLQALQHAQKASLRGKEKDVYKSLSELYHKLHQNDKAYFNRLRYEALNDSALNEETYKQVNDLQASYEIEKRNAQIKLLNKDKELAYANAEQDLLYRYILLAACIITIVFMLILWRNVRLKQRLNKTLKNENKHLEEENILAKYEVLKSRVNPHFLFNSLNTLSSIIEIDKQKAIEFIEHFSELYRQVLESGDVNFITLKEELKISNSYVYLQKVRFGDKLHITFNTFDELKYTLPSFVIQMMIENAIKHNIISSSRNLFITITQQENVLIIENNLQLRTRQVPSTKIGQQNIIDRYKHFNQTIPIFEQTETHYKVFVPLMNQSIQFKND